MPKVNDQNRDLWFAYRVIVETIEICRAKSMRIERLALTAVSSVFTDRGLLLGASTGGNHPRTYEGTWKKVRRILLQLEPQLSDVGAKIRLCFAAEIFHSLRRRINAANKRLGIKAVPPKTRKYL